MPEDCTYHSETLSYDFETYVKKTPLNEVRELVKRQLECSISDNCKENYPEHLRGLLEVEDKFKDIVQSTVDSVKQELSEIREEIQKSKEGEGSPKPESVTENSG
ncbi:hypothetical protein JCGZ_16842 [Jatropha curcas]|uniref:Uncharacterized protein n=1 Tax=Jatropha curcas TaxID=180498 RepID=A0A067LG68_JATCU|nr:hypothetical protein JCGZ_16842 [Jatropha curcas]